MAKDSRAYVTLECTVCSERFYRTSKRVKGETYRLNIKKYCRRCRQHTMHKDLKK